MLLVICLIALVSVAATSPAWAQSNLQVNQTADFVYGDRLEFDVLAAETEPLVEARLVIDELNHGEIYNAPATIAADSTISTHVIVPVKSLGLGAFAQLTYHWEFVDKNGAKLESDQQKLLYEDTSVPWHWKTLNEGNLFVHTDGRNGELAQAALDMASGALARTGRSLGNVQIVDDIHVYVYPELASMAASLRLHQQRVQDWVAAYAFPDQRIVLVAYSESADSLPSLERDIEHEMAHLVVNAAAGNGAGNIPGWLNEGLAFNASTTPDAALRDVLNKAVGSGVLLSADTLCARSFTALPPRDAALAYAESASLVKYIIDRYGVSQIRALLAAYADGRDCNDGVRLALGLSLTQLEAQWHSDLSRTPVKTPQDSGSMIPWLLAWITSLTLACLFITPTARQAEEPLAYQTRVAVSSIPDQ